jgi:tRNA (cmo5U34)-methyltransferase
VTDPRDTLYADPLSDHGLFTFDDNVARVFPDMIKRSVPGYPTIVSMTGLLAGRYAIANSTVYDLGCSLGASTLAMRQHIRQPGCRIVSVDNSSAMLERCRNVVAASAHNADDVVDASPTPTGSQTDSPTHYPAVDLVLADLQDVAIENASVAVLNFTLQFIPRELRDDVIARICRGLLPGGIMVLSEKVTFEDPHLDALNIELHHQFKRDNGYSEMEVARKRNALEQVLLPETLNQHKQRIAAAGFNSCDVWFQCFNFASLIALK